MQQFGIGARLRALREMAGYRSMGALVKALEDNGASRGLGETTLRLVEREQRVAEPRELQEIASLCGVPLEWFTADFDRLPAISEPARAVIARETREAVERSRARHEGTLEDSRTPQRADSRP